jgi:hypothetical protein
MSQIGGYGYRRCRLLSHSWDEIDSTHWAVGAVWQRTCVPMTLMCQHCSMERRDVIEKGTADVVARRYVQPPNYRMNKADYGGERPKRGDFRLAWLNDHLIELRKERQDRRQS